MNRSWFVSGKVVGGLLAAALCALPQGGYTISAKPGAVNYVEGNASLDGQPIGTASLKSTFMNAGSLLETQDGKVEVLLTPGVFLRVGDHSRIRMLKPSLIDTQVAVEEGESMLEVDQYVRDSHLTVSMRGGLTSIEKNGLYRFMADGQPSVAVIDGKAEVSFGERHTSLGKGREALLSDALKTQEFDKNRDDELYAWSNIRAQYDASLTYQAARTAANSYGSGSSGGGYAGYDSYFGPGAFGYNGFYGPGWCWSNGFNSWLWMPGGQFYSPFGWGFYGPGYVGYAPVVVVPVVVAGGTGTSKPVLPIRPRPLTSVAGITVPVNPKHVPAIGVYAASPASFAAASAQSARAISASGGLRTYAGAPAWSGSRGFGGGAPASRASGGGGSTGGGFHPSSSGGSFGGGGGGHAAAGGGAKSK